MSMNNPNNITKALEALSKGGVVTDSIIRGVAINHRVHFSTLKEAYNKQEENT